MRLVSPWRLTHPVRLMSSLGLTKLFCCHFTKIYQKILQAMMMMMMSKVGHKNRYLATCFLSCNFYKEIWRTSLSFSLLFRTISWIRLIFAQIRKWNATFWLLWLQAIKTLLINIHRIQYVPSLTKSVKRCYRIIEIIITYQKYLFNQFSQQLSLYSCLHYQLAR